MKTGDTIYINGRIPATIKCFLGNHKVVVTFGVTGRYTTSMSNIYRENGKLIIKSEIFK